MSEPTGAMDDYDLRLMDKRCAELEAERDTAVRTRDEAQAASNRDLEAKWRAERLLIDSRNIQEAEKKILIGAVEKNSKLRAHVAMLHGVLEKTYTAWLEAEPINVELSMQVRAILAATKEES